jgi:hypothetical protein
MVTAVHCSCTGSVAHASLLNHVNHSALLFYSLLVPHILLVQELSYECRDWVDPVARGWSLLQIHVYPPGADMIANVFGKPGSTDKFSMPENPGVLVRYSNP